MVEAVSNVAVTAYIVSQLVVTAEERNVKSVTIAKLQKMILIKLKTLMMAPVTIYLTINFSTVNLLRHVQWSMNE